MSDEGPHDPPLSEGPGALASRPDFALGNARVRPSIKTIEGPLGSVKGEPRVIQVLLALFDADGRVLSREDLLQQCWQGRIVGDDAVHRAIAETRRLASVAGADFQIETVPRVGYRLVRTGPVTGERQAAPHAAPKLDRRRFVGTALASVAAAGAAGGALWLNRREAHAVDALIERGRVVRGSGGPDAEQQAEKIFRQAIRLDEDRAEAWGWLASVLQQPDAAREAALRALALDGKEANARTVLAFQSRDLEAWTKWEDALLGVLADHPDCANALAHLTLFYQGMGRCRDSLHTNERAIGIEPFNPEHQARRAMKHWIFGKLGEADKVADRALQLWPANPTVWNARLIMYAFTDRPDAARALLEDVPGRPLKLTDPSLRSWRAALDAIATRAPTDIDRAVEVCTQAARLAPGLAANAIMVFSHLSELDAAFEVARGLLENRGGVVQQHRSRGISDLYSGPTWGRTQFLFIPVTAPFRGDKRFADLCRSTGHTDYWRRRGIWPDAFVRGALRPG